MVISPSSVVRLTSALETPASSSLRAVDDGVDRTCDQRIIGAADAGIDLMKGRPDRCELLSAPVRRTGNVRVLDERAVLAEANAHARRVRPDDQCEEKRDDHERSLGGSGTVMLTEAKRISLVNRIAAMYSMHQSSLHPPPGVKVMKSSFRIMNPALTKK